MSFNNGLHSEKKPNQKFSQSFIYEKQYLSGEVITIMRTYYGHYNPNNNQYYSDNRWSERLISDPSIIATLPRLPDFCK